MDYKTIDKDYTKDSAKKRMNKINYKVEIIWNSVFIMVMLHLSAVKGLYLAITSAKYQTVIFLWITIICAQLGMQCGAHRLWSHRSYKAKLPLQILLFIFFILGCQKTIYDWVQQHRLHHKYSDTDADPHNANRGFFFSHIGWTMCKQHPDVIEKRKKIDLSDIEKDPVVQFEKNNYIFLVWLLWGVIPTLIPYYLWNESLNNSYFICVTLRHALALNMAFLINSAAHLWGMRPYTQGIKPTEATARHLLIGEGYHNYHHTFAWDYSASEYGSFGAFNPATAFIDFFAWIGWAYDRRKANKTMIELRKMSKGIPGYGNRSGLYEYLTGILTWLTVLSPFIFGFYMFDRNA